MTKVRSPSIADKICKLCGISKRDNPGKTIFSKKELQGILTHLSVSSETNNDRDKEVKA